MKKYKIADGKDNKGFVLFSVFPNWESYFVILQKIGRR
jgi:hypothetical protein